MKNKDKRINRVVGIIREITIKYLGCGCLNKTAKKYFYEVAKSILVELNKKEIALAGGKLIISTAGYIGIGGKWLNEIRKVKKLEGKIITLTARIDNEP